MAAAPFFRHTGGNDKSPFFFERFASNDIKPRGVSAKKRKDLDGKDEDMADQGIW
jgi:hypothetical protein